MLGEKKEEEKKKIGSRTQKLIGIHRDHGECINLILFFKMKK
jgi:hypothetical protein